jgi:leucyl-tRNA synthetase
VPRGAANDVVVAAALALPEVQRAMAGKSLSKSIVVPNRIVNLVAA